ncbi:MAG: HNH endonuclease [Chloroflexi bacterium]|nr:HNH endonuclease [Chloroflexota bacterium]
MSRRSRAAGCSYIPLVILTFLLFLWAFGFLRVQVTSEVNVPPELQTPIAEIPKAISTLAPSLTLPNPAAAPTVSGPPAIGRRTKTMGCVAANTLPDPACTPGAIFATATSDQVCVAGYSASVRDVPDTLKDVVYAEYGLPRDPPGNYEVDHLIPLALGGSNDIANLWPQGAEPRPGSEEKDRVENYLQDQVCRGAMPLQQAQTDIATNWVGVYQRMGK